MNTNTLRKPAGAPRYGWRKAQARSVNFNAAGPGYNRNYCNDLLGKSLEKAMQQGGGQHEGQYDIQNAHVLLKIQYFTIFADYYTRNCVPKRKIRQKI